MSGRTERITRMLHDLQGEITDAVREGAISAVSFWFYVPSQNAAEVMTFCRFRTDLVPVFDLDMSELKPRLKITSQKCGRPGFAARRASAQRRAASF